jgi:folate-binding protein YgfZ
MADAMTESVLTPTGQAITSVATALATHLTAPSSVAASTPELINYRGALTPQHLDAPGAETGALLRGAAVHDLGWLRRIAVRGEDRFRWLSGMVTNAVETLPDRSGAYNLVLNAQGRIQGDVYVWRSGENLELEITSEQCEVLLGHFDGFIIMDDVELIPLPDQAALGITGPDADAILAKLGLPLLSEELMSTTSVAAEIPIQLFRSYGTVVSHYVLWASIEDIPGLWQAVLAAGASPVGAASLETLRIVEGIPAYGIDIQSRDLAQETNQTRALSFTKGCYLGQEIVERIRSRGQVHRHLRAVEVVPDEPGKMPASGTELSSPNISGKPAGILTSVATLELDGAQRIFGIAMIRAEAEVGSDPLVYPRGMAQILKTPPELTKFATA